VRARGLGIQALGIRRRKLLLPPKLAHLVRLVGTDAQRGPRTPLGRRTQRPSPGETDEHPSQAGRKRSVPIAEGRSLLPRQHAVCLRTRPPRPNVVFESGQFTTILAMVAAGTGVSVVPHMAVEPRPGCRFIRWPMRVHFAVSASFNSSSIFAAAPIRHFSAHPTSRPREASRRRRVDRLMERRLDNRPPPARTIDERSAASVVAGFSQNPSAPALHLRPEPSECAEFCALTDEDVDITFQRIGIVGGCAHVLDVLPELLECFPVVVKNNHAIA